MAALLSVIVPAYNEAARLAESVPLILEYLGRCKASSELIVVDDGSTDNTAAVAEQSMRNAGRVAAQVISYQPNRGKGYAVRRGLLAGQGQNALFSDADLSAPID